MHHRFLTWLKVSGMAPFCILLMSQLLTGSGCAAEEQAKEQSAIPTGFEEKSPRMPTLFVDTSGKEFAWHKAYNHVQSIENRIQPPEGYSRPVAEKESFGYWLRRLPLKPGKPQVKLFNGDLKGNQGAQYAVLDIDVGKSDLQQCADAVMRLRAEYLFSQERFGDIHFNFTSGDNCDWNRWAKGLRPVTKGNSVSWKQNAGEDGSYTNFKKYMKKVFMYAGTASLSKELLPRKVKDIEIGDVFIQGGFPGHAVLVVDVVESVSGQKLFLLAQSYMPAQDIHILRNPFDEGLSPWFAAGSGNGLYTPEWNFEWKNLMHWGN